jgi:ribosomal protein S27E
VGRISLTKGVPASPQQRAHLARVCGNMKGRKAPQRLSRTLERLRSFPFVTDIKKGGHHYRVTINCLTCGETRTLQEVSAQRIPNLGVCISCKKFSPRVEQDIRQMKALTFVKDAEKIEGTKNYRVLITCPDCSVERWVISNAYQILKVRVGRCRPCARSA